MFHETPAKSVKNFLKIKQKELKHKSYFCFTIVLSKKFGPFQAKFSKLLLCENR